MPRESRGGQEQGQKAMGTMTILSSVASINHFFNYIEFHTQSQPEIEYKFKRYRHIDINHETQVKRISFLQSAVLLL